MSKAILVNKYYNSGKPANESTFWQYDHAAHEYQPSKDNGWELADKYTVLIPDSAEIGADQVKIWHKNGSEEFFQATKLVHRYGKTLKKLAN